MKPDMAKVREALLRYGKRRGKDTVHYPLKPSPVAQDVAIRKPLKAHGITNRSGFSHPHFLNHD